VHDFEIKNVSIKEVNHGGAKPSWGLNTFSYFESDGGQEAARKRQSTQDPPQEWSKSRNRGKKESKYFSNFLKCL
jgi:hypothetical protein